MTQLLSAVATLFFKKVLMLHHFKSYRAEIWHILLSLGLVGCEPQTMNVL